MGIARDNEGRITGGFGYSDDVGLKALTDAERALWPNLAWLADGLDPAVARADHPVVGPLDVLVDRWCERRELGPLSRVLPSYLAGPSGLASWQQLLAALESIRDTADALPQLPAEDFHLVVRLIAETARIVSIGQGC